MSFNQLTPKQVELLALLIEECGEAAQAATKILRHGLRSHHPRTGVINQLALEDELIDVMAAMAMLSTCGVIAEPSALLPQVGPRGDRKTRYLHHWEDPA